MGCLHSPTPTTAVAARRCPSATLTRMMISSRQQRQLPSRIDSVARILCAAVTSTRQRHPPTSPTVSVPQSSAHARTAVAVLELLALETDKQCAQAATLAMPSSMVCVMLSCTGTGDHGSHGDRASITQGVVVLAHATGRGHVIIPHQRMAATPVLAVTLTTRVATHAVQQMAHGLLGAASEAVTSTLAAVVLGPKHARAHAVVSRVAAAVAQGQARTLRHAARAAQ